jgi:hypothetical protein
MKRLPSGLMLTEYREHGTQDSPNREVIYGPLLRAFPPEMPVPFMAAGIEQSGQLPGLSVSRGDVGSLEGIAIETAQTKVTGNRWTAVLLRYDVVDLKGTVRSRRFLSWSCSSGKIPR